MSEFKDGDRVWWDDAAAVIIKRTIDGPSGSPMYLVRWAGSDLVKHEE